MEIAPTAQATGQSEPTGLGGRDDPSRVEPQAVGAGVERRPAVGAECARCQAKGTPERQREEPVGVGEIGSSAAQRDEPGQGECQQECQREEQADGDPGDQGTRPEKP